MRLGPSGVVAAVALVCSSPALAAQPFDRGMVTITLDDGYISGSSRRLIAPGRSA